MTAEGRNPQQTGRSTFIVMSVATVLAVAFQIQATPKLGGSLIRVSLADLISPILFAALAIALVRERLLWPRWSVPRLWIWLGVLSAVLAMALLVGRVKFGYWLPWAAVNKFGGWFALIWYFVVGGLVAAVLGADGKERFLKVFLAFLWISCAVSVLGYLLYQANAGLPNWLRYSRAEGFMRNPNAFGLMVAVAIAVQLPYAKAGALFGTWAHRVGLALALTALVLAGSRSAWLGVLFAAPLLAASRSVPWRSLGVAMLTACVLLVGLLFGTPELLAERQADYQSVSGGYVFNEPMFSSSDRGFSYRYRTGLAALGLWWREPILGAGLGGFPHSLITAGQPAEVIHNTYLWLLTETGAIGVIVFAAFFVTLLRALWRNRSQSDDADIAIAGLAMLLAFAGAAIGMEAIYQRHVWFILGLALALPVAARPTAAIAERQ